MCNHSREEELCIIKRRQVGARIVVPQVFWNALVRSPGKSILEWLAMLSTICFRGKLHHFCLIVTPVMMGLKDEPDPGRKTCFIRQMFLLCSLFYPAGGAPWFTDQHCRSRKKVTKTTFRASWTPFFVTHSFPIWGCLRGLQHCPQSRWRGTCP
jgi:hypothetical protein